MLTLNHNELIHINGGDWASSGDVILSGGVVVSIGLGMLISCPATVPAALLAVTLYNAGIITVCIGTADLLTGN